MTEQQLSCIFPQDWQEDSEIGNQYRTCKNCKVIFVGSFERTVCKECANLNEEKIGE